MRFRETIHWSEGLFLEPHHLQLMSRTLAESVASERALFMPFASGFVDLEIDAEALRAQRIVVRRLSAIMPDGTQLSMPGNTQVAPVSLDLLAADLFARDSAMVYLAVPSWREGEANVDDGSGKRRYRLVQKTLADENTGGDEIDVAVRTMASHLTLGGDAADGFVRLPLMRLVWVAKNTAGPRLAVDPSYMPPFLTVSADCPLLDRISELVFELRRCRDKIQSELEAEGFDPEHLTGKNLQRVLQLRSLNRFEARVTSRLAPERITPFDLYIELRTLAAELAALQPLSKSEVMPEYDHFDAMPVFAELMLRIRALLLAEGGAGYARFEFSNIQAEGRNALCSVKISDDVFMQAQDWYLAVRTEGEPRDAVRMIEAGDSFRLVAPRDLGLRTRGMRLVEVRYPPRYLPVLPHTVWLRIERSEPARAWRSIAEARQMAIDFAPEDFPGLSAALYATTMDHGSGK